MKPRLLDVVGYLLLASRDLEQALTSPTPTIALQEALSRLTYSLDYLDQHPKDF